MSGGDGSGAVVEMELITETEPIQTNTDMMLVGPGTIKVAIMHDGTTYGTLWLDAEEAEVMGEGLLRKAAEARKLTKNG